MDIITQESPLVKWTDKKKENLFVSRKMIDAGFPERGTRMKFCGQYLDMKICPDCGKSIVSSANLCRDRLCPTCSWRLSLKRFAEMCSTISLINDLECFNAGFLTLTVKNCKPENLGYTISEMAKAWNRVLANRDIKEIVYGWSRSVEITYNSRTGEFHPHYHIILLYDPTIHEGSIRALTSRLWSSSCRFNYTPVTDFRIIKSDEGEGTNLDNENIIKAILETFKYSVKSSEFENMPIATFRHLVNGITGKRLVSYGGIIKTARKELGFKKDELSDEDDEITKQEICSCGTEMQRALLKWSFTDSQYHKLSEFGI